MDSNILSSKGALFAARNEYQKALELTQQSLKIAQGLKTPTLVGTPQFTIAEIYAALGDYNKSREFYQQGLATAQELQNRQSEAVALLLIGETYFAQGEAQKTVEQAKKALSIFQANNQPRAIAFTQRSLSLGYGELGKDKEAMEAAQAFLTFARKVKNPVFEKQALTLIGSLHRKFGRLDQAIDTYQQALAIPSDNQVTGADSGIYAGLAQVYRERNQPTIAIAYYKQAIDKIETVRRGIEGLPPELQNTFLQATVDFNQTKTADIYRQLADLLISQGRLMEAQEVLELLRAEEIRDFTRQTRTQSDRPEVSYTEAELAVLKEFKGTIVAFAEKVYRCEKGLDHCNDEQKQKLDQQREQLNQKFKMTVREIETQAKQDQARIVSEGRDKFLKSYQTIVESPPEVKNAPETALIYPLVLEDRITLLWATKGGLLRATKPISLERSQLSNAVQRLKELLTTNSNLDQLKATSKELYTWLIEPLAEDLTNKKIRHLVFSLDSVTQYIPMAALFDGKQFLIEKYSISSITLANNTDTRDRLGAIQETPVLALGVAKAFPRFPKLDYVQTELDAIVKKSPGDDSGIYPGQELLDDKFNEATLKNKIAGHKILHIATHGKFSPTRGKESFLLLGDGKEYPIKEIQYLRNLGDLHLVVLSACETGVGNGNEIAGISSYFIGSDSKAKSVLASLWKVNDLSTSVLMQNFYRELATGKITKAEALQQVQLSMLHRKLTAKNASISRSDNAPTSRSDVEPQVSLRTSPPPVDFSHPYYWAPFVLVGNRL